MPGNSTTTVARSKNGSSLRMCRTDAAWLRAHGLASVESILKCPAPAAVAVNRSSETFPVRPDPGLGGVPLIYVKRHRYRRFTAQLRQIARGTFLGRSRSRYEFEFLEEMRKRGVPAVRPIAYGEKRRSGLLRACVLITEGRPGVESLDCHVLRSRETRRDDRERRLIAELGRTIRRMHDAGVAHGALFWRNILIDTEAEDGKRFTFLDPDRRGRFFAHAVPTRYVRSDLSDVFASALALNHRGSASRFLCAYRSTPRLTAPDRAELRRMLEIAARKRPNERHRVAIAETLGRLHRHVAAAETHATERFHATSLDDFFEKLERCAPAAGDTSTGPYTIQFVLHGASGNEDVVRRCIRMEEGRLIRVDGEQPDADLTIESDKKSWLSIVNGEAQTIPLIQDGKLRLTGDTTLAARLARTIGSG